MQYIRAFANAYFSVCGNEIITFCNNYIGCNVVTAHRKTSYANSEESQFNTRIQLILTLQISYWGIDI